MIENIQEKEEEVKAIWEKYKDTERAKEIFLNRLNSYFEPKLGTKDWITFIIWIRNWKGIKPIRGRKVQKEAESMTDEQAEEIQNLNRKKAIIMLRNILSKYDRNPNFFQNLTAKDITLIYKTIQDAEEAMRRTKIAKSKLGLEAAKTFFLPYQRMSPEELKLLKEQLDVSFERLLQLRAPGLTE